MNSCGVDLHLWVYRFTYAIFTGCAFLSIQDVYFLPIERKTGMITPLSRDDTHNLCSESCGICSSNMICFGSFFLELSILREFSFQTLPRSSKLRYILRPKKRQFTVPKTFPKKLFRYFNFLPPPSRLQKIGVSRVCFPNFPRFHQEPVNTLTAASRFIAGGKSGCWGIRSLTWTLRTCV